LNEVLTTVTHADTRLSPRVSFVIPVLNEGERLETELPLFIRACRAAGVESAEYALATDNGNPETLMSLERLSANTGVRALCLTQRIGKGGTFKNCVPYLRGKVVVLIDADLPVSVRDVTRALDTLKGKRADIVTADRVSRNHGALRVLLSAGFNTAVRIMFRTGVRDHHAGFKVFSSEALAKIVPRVRSDGYEFETEMLVHAKKLGLKTATLKVRWKERRDRGSSSVRPLRTTLMVLMDLIALMVLSPARSAPKLERVAVGKVVDASSGKTLGPEYMTRYATKHSVLFRVAAHLYFALLR
jgi:dolichyl-phosphate beta-glucosyltransferase